MKSFVAFSYIREGAFAYLQTVINHKTEGLKSNMYMEDLKLDKALTFEHKGCEGIHYIIGNPHTHPGRILGWCEHKQRSFFFSLSEILNPTVESKFWIQGFLSGNEPHPPEINGNVDFESEEYKHWQDKVKSFNETGYWEYE